MSRHRSAAHPIGLPSLAVCAAIAAAATVFALIFAAVVFVHRTVQSSPSGTEETIGGLDYSVNNAWILDPSRRIDAQVAKGLPAADRHVGRGRLLYAVFVGVTNPTDRRLPMASDIALRDMRNREYAAVPLAAGNAYAYRPGVVPPKRQEPAASSPAGRNMSAEGSLLVFKVPRKSYDDGPLQLVVHDPAHPASVSTIQVA